jgi:hypothetical protein
MAPSAASGHKRHPLTFLKHAIARGDYPAVVSEVINASIVPYEAVSLLLVEPLHNSWSTLHCGWLEFGGYRLAEHYVCLGAERSVSLYRRRCIGIVAPSIAAFGTLPL